MEVKNDSRAKGGEVSIGGTGLYEGLRTDPLRENCRVPGSNNGPAVPNGG
ncbi:hypothetical protein GCM10007426_14480 [Alloalcanivorax dieselolei]|nr:hypothetical protein GCM10007426_14480 [Alloalcanivorax dieselolei]